MINKILARNPEKINDDLISLIINKTKRNIVNLNLLCLELFSNSTEHIQISLFNDIFKSIFHKLHYILIFLFFQILNLNDVD